MFCRMLVALGLALHLACGAAEDDQVLARVDTEEITAADLRRFREEMPALLRSDKAGIEELDEYLRTMIDVKLMLLEARSRGIDQTPEYLEEWEGERRRKLVAAFLHKHIQEKIALPPEEVQRRFKESKWSRMLKLAHIRLQTEEEARGVLAQLEGGRRFEDLARERSIWRETAEQGGLLEPFFGRGNLEELGLPVEIAEQVFELKVGEFGGPFPLLGGYEVFAVVDERPAPASYGLVFAQTTFMQEFNARRQEVKAELKERFAARLDPEGLRLLIDKGGTPGPGDPERERVLGRFAGGRLTAGDFADAYQRVAALRPIQFDSSGVAGFVENHLLPEALIFRAAQEEGLEKEPSLAAWMKARQESLLVESLKEQEVDRQIDLGEDALRQYYEAHRERFMQPEEIRVVEILSRTQAEAEQFRRRVQGGEDVMALAERHSIRQGAARARGAFHMHPFEQPRYKEILDAAQQAPVGSLVGPLQTADGYSVFKVLAKLPAQPQPFDQAAAKVRYWLRQEEEKRLFEALLARLREEYQPRIVLFEDRLAKVADADSGA